jgi:hypothetical protein
VQGWEQKGESFASACFGLDQAVAAPSGKFRQNTLLDERHVRESHHVEGFQQSGIQLPSHTRIWLSTILNLDSFYHDLRFNEKSKKPEDGCLMEILRVGAR